jgi:hypothetical protein
VQALDGVAGFLERGHEILSHGGHEFIGFLNGGILF